MKILKYPCVIPVDTAVALGRFDGVHHGHSAVISAAVKCKDQGLVPVVFTFSDNPGKEPHGLLTTESEKYTLLEQLGVQIVVTVAFDEVRNMSPEDFVSCLLLGQLRAKEIFCGYNYRFGAGAAADADTLAQLCAEEGVNVTCIPEVMVGDRQVSSTAIRKLISEGKVLAGEELLGHRYSLSGKVVHGNAIGRKINTPTLNIDVDKQKLLPRYGVYAAKVFTDGVEYNSVCNIGEKPTVGSELPTVEAYLLDVKGDFYDAEVTLELLEFIRPEQKFSDIESLRSVISKDISEARRIFDK
ncbi:MAG: bifunctional riboflavin kinase/FAD synthetase [Ruminococcus sp.]|nr:bifunctional riboflavin kinase/FAD synthetase [Ruminococcus sp.]